MPMFTFSHHRSMATKSCHSKHSSWDKKEQYHSFALPTDAMWQESASWSQKRCRLKMSTTDDGRTTTTDGRRMPAYTISSTMSLLLVSWSKHCVSYCPCYNLPQLQLAPLSPIEACFRCWNIVLTITKLWPCIFFLSFFGYSLIRTLDDVTNYNICSQRKRVWSVVFKQSPVCI